MHTLGFLLGKLLLTLLIFLYLKTIEKLKKDLDQMQRNMDEIQSSHRRDISDLNEHCDSRIAQAEKEVCPLF